MATGEITTLPSTPEDGGSGGFPPGGFKDPKRLYCKNGGFFLRIRSDGGVDGIREKNDPHSKYFHFSLSPCFEYLTKLRYVLFDMQWGNYVIPARCKQDSYTSYFLNQWE